MTLRVLGEFKIEISRKERNVEKRKECKVFLISLSRVFAIFTGPVCSSAGLYRLVNKKESLTRSYRMLQGSRRLPVIYESVETLRLTRRTERTECDLGVFLF